MCIRDRPLATASIATITLFQIVGHWNEWFSATIFVNDRNKWPLQTLLRQMLTTIDYSTFSAESLSQLRQLSDRSFRGAMIIFATIPILCIYPFMQKYFVTGIKMCIRDRKYIGCNIPYQTWTPFLHACLQIQVEGGFFFCSELSSIFSFSLWLCVPK